MRRIMRPVISLWLMLVLPQLAGSQNLTLPLHQDSLRFAVIGDTGTGDKASVRSWDDTDTVPRQVSFRVRADAGR